MADFHGTIISVEVLYMKPDEPSNNFIKQGYQSSADFSRKERHPQLEISVDCQITKILFRKAVIFNVPIKSNTFWDSYCACN